MWRKILQTLCQHRFQALHTRSYYDPITDTVIITETCIKCGKQFSFHAPFENFLKIKPNDERR